MSNNRKGSKGRNNASKCDYDVTIAVYTHNRDMAVIRFHSGLDYLITDDDNARVRLVNKSNCANKLYFMPWKDMGANKQDSVALNFNKLQFYSSSQVKLLKKFIGEYSLEYDVNEHMYYIDLNNVHKVIPHTDYTKGKRVEIPKHKDIVMDIKPAVRAIKAVKKEIGVLKEEPKKESKKESKDKNEIIIQLLDVLDDYDKNDNVYAAGHTLIKTIKELL